MASNHRRRHAGTCSQEVRLLLMVASFLAVPAAHAGSWQFTPRLGLEETYTDNVRLTRDDISGDFMTTVTPGISVRGDSRRLKTSLDYNLRQQYFAEESKFDQHSHQLQSVMNAVVLENWLFVDSTSRVSQQDVDNRHHISDQSRGSNRQLSDVVSNDIAPRLEHVFGNVGKATLGYSHLTIDRTIQRGSVFPGSLNNFNDSGDEDLFNLTLQSGAVLSRTPTTIRAMSRETDYESGRNTRMRNVSVDTAYVWSRDFRFTASGGMDSNEFDARRGRADGPYWSVGGEWTPSNRTSLAVDWGKRFFGSTLDVKFNHRQRHWTFLFDYGTAVRTASEYERALTLVPLEDPFGIPIVDPVTSQQILVPIDSPGATDDVFVEQRLNGTLTYHLRRDDFHLRFFDFKRKFQGTAGRNEDTRGVTFDATHRIRRRLSTVFSMTWRQYDDSRPSNLNSLLIANEVGDYFSVSPIVSYELGPHTTARLRYQYVVNNGGSGLGFGGDPAQTNYTENSISVSLLFHL